MSAKILLIEDERTMLNLLSTLVRMEGFEALELEQDDDIDAILNLLHDEKPAVILLDVNLRQFSGFDLLYRLRQDAELSDIRVIMSSGIDFSDRCLAEGADAFILKPYMPEELMSKIRQNIERLPTNRE